MMRTLMRVATLLGLLVCDHVASQTTVSTCDDLRDFVESGGGNFILENNVMCEQTITVGSGTTVIVDGRGYQMEIITPFLPSDPTDGSLFVSEDGADLTLLNIVFLDAGDGSTGTSSNIRAVYNSGSLLVDSCTFSRLNQGAGTGASGGEGLYGGAIYTNGDHDGDAKVKIANSVFESNTAIFKGGAICAEGSDPLEIDSCSFKLNEADYIRDLAVAKGGTIYAARGVPLTVSSSEFSDDSATSAGSAIFMCGGTLADSSFRKHETYGEAYPNAAIFGAVASGEKGGEECPPVTVTNCNFTENVGGAMAVFEGDLIMKNVAFTDNGGGGLYFSSSSPSGRDILELDTVFFVYNKDPPPKIILPTGQGTGVAAVIENTSEEEDSAPVGTFTNIFCFRNDPFECEWVQENIVSRRDNFVCRPCDLQGVPGEFGDNISNDEASHYNSIILGLSITLGVIVLLITCLGMWKCRVKRSARRLMDDMRHDDNL
ncbi:unnamed protein product [Discosporangium mesarthrocarpum]